MAMNAALSGLRAAQTAIDATSHNISNVGTAGFRASRVLFSDVFSTSPESIAKLGVGQGTEVSAINQDFTSGSIQATGRPLDLAISGAGFFAVQVPDNVAGNGGQTLYTRSGDFALNERGVLTNTAGNIVLTWPVSVAGDALSHASSVAGPVTVPFSMGKAMPSSAVAMKVELPSSASLMSGQTAVPPAAAFSPADPTTWAYRASVPLVGEGGTAEQGEVYFTKTAAPTAAAPETTWRAQMVVNGTARSSVASDLTFDADGRLTTAMPLSFGTAGGGALALDLTGSTLQDSAFTVQSASADGSTPSKMTTIQVDAAGTIWASYGAGQPIAQGQLMLATFPNPGGLMQTGNASFAATTESGQPIVGSPLTGGFGKMTSGGLEGSNVDLTVQLVDLITAQRDYQASAKALETSSSLIKTIMNLST